MGTTVGIGGIGGLGNDDQSGSVAGLAIGAVVGIAVIIVVVVVLASVLLRRRHRTQSKDLSDTQKNNVFYETVSVVKLPPTTGGGEVHIFRESVYNFDTNQQLELHLESEICVKV